MDGREDKTADRLSMVRMVKNSKQLVFQLIVFLYFTHIFICLVFNIVFFFLNKISVGGPKDWNHLKLKRNLVTEKHLRSSEEKQAFQVI